MAIADTCPLLEELDINFPLRDARYGVADEGMVYLSMRLKYLRTIRIISWRFTDMSLHALVSNCAYLREIEFTCTNLISPYGVALVIRNCASATAIKLRLPVLDAVKESFVHARGLCELDLSHSTLSDELLFSIATAQLFLKKLNLAWTGGITAAGIITLLSKSQSLEHLDLEAVEFLTDQDIIAITNFVSKLYSINLSWCRKLTSISLFNVVRGCPLLNNIKFQLTNLGEVNDAMHYVMNPKIKILNVFWNRNISTQCLMKVLSVCPKLEELDVSFCRGIPTDGGIIEILRVCPELKHLNMGYSKIRASFDIDFEDSKLESLRAPDSSLCDETLETIANKCKGLVRLDLSGCSNVTAKGVRKIIKRCKLLKELNLIGLVIDDSIVSNPSLRIISTLD